MHAPLPLSLPADRALLDLLVHLDRVSYGFVTPTPATHARVVARADRRVARNLADVLGWSLPFDRGAIDADVVDMLADADMLVARDGRLVSRVRV